LILNGTTGHNTENIPPHTHRHTSAQVQLTYCMVPEKMSVV